MNATGERLRIAYLTPLDPMNKRSWSGTTYFMARALQEHCGEVTFLGPAEIGQIAGKIYNRLVRSLLGKRYDYSHSIPYARKCAQFFEKKLEGRSFDVIFAPAASTGIAFLNTTVPIVYASDVTCTLLHNYYPEFSNLLEKSTRDGNFIENAAISKSRIALFSSDWAALSAVRDYGATREKIHVIPFGANIDKAPSKEAVLSRGKPAKLRLLFLAVNWFRKGGDIAYETLVSLVKSGVNAELIVCGCVPPFGLCHERMTVIPFLDKNDPFQMQELTELFMTSDFLFLPTRYDCTPIVFCEANAFGLPVVTTDTGGVSGVIRNGENGFILPFSAGGEAYAEAIAGIFRDDQQFAAVRRSSRQAFDERLNWDSWGLAVRRIFDEIMANNGSTAKSR